MLALRSIRMLLEKLEAVECKPEHKLGNITSGLTRDRELSVQVQAQADVMIAGMRIGMTIAVTETSKIKHVELHRRRQEVGVAGAHLGGQEYLGELTVQTQSVDEAVVISVTPRKLLAS